MDFINLLNSFYYGSDLQWYWNPITLLEKTVIDERLVYISTLKENINQLHTEVTNYAGASKKQSMSFDRDSRYVKNYDVLMLLCVLNKYLTKDSSILYEKYMQIMDIILDKKIFDHLHRIQYQYGDQRHQTYPISVFELAVMNNLENVAVKFLDCLRDFYNRNYKLDDQFLMYDKLKVNDAWCNKDIGASRNNNLFMVACAYKMDRAIGNISKIDGTFRIKNSQKDTALILLCKNSMDEAASLALSSYNSFIYIWEKDINRESAMQIAVKNNMTKTINRLLESDIIGPTKAMFRSDPPLSSVTDVLEAGCIYGNKKVVETLLKRYKFDAETMVRMKELCNIEEIKNLIVLPNEIVYC